MRHSKLLSVVVTCLMCSSIYASDFFKAVDTCIAQNCQVAQKPTQDIEEMRDENSIELAKNIVESFESRCFAQFVNTKSKSCTLNLGAAYFRTLKYDLSDYSYPYRSNLLSKELKKLLEVKYGRSIRINFVEESKQSHKLIFTVFEEV